MRLAAEPSVTVDGSHKVDSLIECRDVTHLFELAFKNEDVRKVDGFSQGNRRHEDVDQTKGVKVSTFWVFTKLFYSGGNPYLGSFQQTQVFPTSNDGTHIQPPVAGTIIAEGGGG